MVPSTNLRLKQRLGLRLSLSPRATGSARHTGPRAGGSLNNRNDRKLPVPRTAGWTCPPEPGRPPLSGLRPHFLPFLFLFFSSFLSFFFFSFLFFFFFFSFSFLFFSLGEHEITALF